MHYLKVKIRPSLNEVEEILREAISKKVITQIATSCKVNYFGRSSSTLNWGERLVILKPDGSVLIHRNKGYDAVNWQPPGCFISLGRTAALLTIRADRRRPRETLIVECRAVLLVSAFSLIDEAPLEMLLTEQEVYKVLIANPRLIAPGFRVSSQQTALGLGRADITGYDADGNYVVVEVKRVDADNESINQVYKYVSNIRHTSDNVRGIIMAPRIRPNAKKLAKTLSIEYRTLDLKLCAELLSKDRLQHTERLDKHL
ncbi:MAG TPA: endonuclease NucS [Nitrososphaerales archaeon]